MRNREGVFSWGELLFSWGKLDKLEIFVYIGGVWKVKLWGVS